MCIFFILLTAASVVSFMPSKKLCSIRSFLPISCSFSSCDFHLHSPQLTTPGSPPRFRSSAFAVAYHIRFSDRQDKKDHYFFNSLKFTFNYFMSFNQDFDNQLGKPEASTPVHVCLFSVKYKAASIVHVTPTLQVFVLPGHPAPFAIVYFVCLSCVSLLFHNLATSLMGEVYTDQEEHTEEHAKRMLNVLADMVTSRRQDGPLLSFAYSFASTFKGFWEIVLKLLAKVLTSFGSRHVPGSPVPRPPSKKNSLSECWSRLNHEDHYLLMSYIQQDD